MAKTENTDCSVSWEKEDTSPIFAVLLLVYRACQNAGDYFASETEDEVYFLRKESPVSERGLRKKSLLGQAEDSANVRIRKIYKKWLRREMRTRPRGSETPRELEEIAGLGKDSDQVLLHTCYEKARYSETGCTMDEAAILKKQVPRFGSQRKNVPDQRVWKEESSGEHQQAGLQSMAVYERKERIMERHTPRLNTGDGDKIFRIVLFLILAFVCIVIIYPLYYVVLASVTDPVTVNSKKALLYPKKLYLDGYRTIFGYPLFWVPYRNTVIYTTVGTLVSLMATIPAGYVLSRKELVGRRLLNGMFLFTMLFNGGTIPLYLTVLKLGIYNTMWAMILPTAVSVYNLLVCRSFFESGIPEEVWEAARVDGCTYMVFFFRFVLPLSRTIMDVMALFYATAQWNQYWNAIMYLRDEEKMPLQVQLTWMAKTDLKYCTVIVAVLPFLVVYPFFQKYFVQGVTIKSVK